jgi:superfamily II DNA or RNA helicase
MRDVRSKNYFEQMVGRGTRTIGVDDLQKVTPSATFFSGTALLFSSTGFAAFVSILSAITVFL